MPPGNEQAKTTLERLLESRREGLLHFFRTSARQREDAEDMTQTTLLLALKFLPTLNAQDSAASWLNQIAANVLKGWQRPGYRRELTGVLAEPQNDEAPDLDQNETQFQFLFSSGYADAAEAALDNLEQERILAALRQLAPRDQTLLTLFYLRGLSNKEIGDLLDMQPKAVTVAVMRARNRLKERL